MWGVTDLGSYLVGLVLIILLPGPNSLYVLSVAARRGVPTGYRAACGVFTGDAVLMTLSALGVVSVLSTHETAFAVVKYLGAGYLGWLAIGMLRAAWAAWRRRALPLATASAVAGTPSTAASTATSTERVFRRALVVSLLNPKAILFFVAFFVQFVDPAYDRPALSFLLLGGLLELGSFVYLSVLILAGARLAEVARRRRRLTAGATSAVGVVFLGFAVKLATASA
ncbi:leucine efflux protein LeuE [Nocardioides flavescens]|uniref:Leucine efflux protein LeuE n=1 Tax=Nocardioides flavescens TaxID=2691959 RepID=A0A6L7F2A5_9ACTN|nr:leucine efflux protein LeuE [Nocardioides flavescens]